MRKCNEKGSYENGQCCCNCVNQKKVLDENLKFFRFGCIASFHGECDSGNGEIYLQKQQHGICDDYSRLITEHIYYDC